MKVTAASRWCMNGTMIARLAGCTTGLQMAQMPSLGACSAVTRLHQVKQVVLLLQEDCSIIHFDQTVVFVRIEFSNAGSQSCRCVARVPGSGQGQPVQFVDDQQMEEIGYKGDVGVR